METVKLTRSDNSKPWGFRISGGKDFGVVLSVQRVNPGSLADQKGLKSGDALLTINGKDTTELRHKEAQDAILKSGNQLEMAVQRGGSSNWKPASKQTAPAGGDNVTAILHQQYNSPLAMYSMNSIAETLTAHAEMIAPGVMGINFMKPEHPINTMSEVYRLVQEEEQNKAKSPTPPKGAPSPSAMAPRRAAPPVKTPPPVAPKPVASSPMMNSPQSATAPAQAPAPMPMHSLKKTAPPPAQAIGTCSDCGRYITSSYARVGDRMLHEDCFRCSTCGTSLQHIGYASLNNKLYCEVHAKLAARVIAAELGSTPSPIPADLGRPAPLPFQSLPNVEPLPLPTTQSRLTQQPAPYVPPIDIPSIPTPYVPPAQPFINLPQTPSSSGGLPFRSISPQPFKRSSGDFHRVKAPACPAFLSDIDISSIPTSIPTSDVPPPQLPSLEPLPSEPLSSEPPSAEVPPPQAPSAEVPPPQAPSAEVPPLQAPPSQFPQHLSHSSGASQFRSISPQPFKRISGDYHRVTAPTSPTLGSAPQMSFQDSGPLPFEAKPYMPPGQALTSFQSSSQVSQTTQISQSFQQTTVSQQSSQSQYQMDYKQIVGQQKGTKFVWPPPKPEELLSEKKSDSVASQSMQQTYSPLATQSSPPESHLPTSLGSSQPTPAPEAPATQPKSPLSSYVPPPLPSTFSKQQEQASVLPASEPAKMDFSIPAPAPAPIVAPVPAPAPPAPTVGLAPGFAPVLAPVVDTESKNLGGVPQSGVPTGAGSRSAPRRGKGQMKEQAPGCRIPICADCGSPIRGPFVIALGKTWCPDHFICNNLHCKRGLQDVGFVEEQGQLYCENCYESFLAPICNKCNVRIKGDCLNALDKSWHPDCFLCAYCHKPFGNSSFYLEDGLPYCEKDWNELFTTKCVGCGYPIEAGDRWVEALNNNYHSQCFKCSICSKNLEGQSFFAKGGRPFCKAHAR